MNNIIGNSKLSIINNIFKHKFRFIINDTKDIVNNFNSFFVKVRPNLAKHISTSNKQPSCFLKGNYLHLFWVLLLKTTNYQH